jgi:large subunit ribosomal protein L25
MKTIEIIGYRRANLGKSESQHLRDEGNVPCVLYGGDNQIHFHAPMILFRELVYTNEAHFVHLNIEGEESQAILQEVQFHPVSEVLLHADFLRISEDRKIKMSIPARLVGLAPGVTKGGALVQKKSALKVFAFPKDMPDHIDVDVSELAASTSDRAAGPAPTRSRIAKGRSTSIGPMTTSTYRVAKANVANSQPVRNR